MKKITRISLLSILLIWGHFLMAQNIATVIKDINVGTEPSNPSGFVAHNNVVYFSAVSNSISNLYKTDGTAAGTQLFNLNLPNSSRRLSDLFRLNNNTYFFGQSQNKINIELWRLDAETPVLIERIDSLLISVIKIITVQDGQAYFIAKTPNDGCNIGNIPTYFFRTAGTTGSTRFIKKLLSSCTTGGGGGSTNTELTYIGQGAFVTDFSSSFSSYPYETHSSSVILNDEAGNTKELLGGSSSTLYGVTTSTSSLVGNPIEFIGATMYLMRLDSLFSITATTNPVFIKRGIGVTCNSAFRQGNVIYFTNNRGEFWRTDGTANGTIMLSAGGSGGPASIAGSQVIGSTLYFGGTQSFQTQHANWGIWKINPTESAPTLLNSICTTCNLSNVNLATINNEVYAFAQSNYGTAEFPVGTYFIDKVTTSNLFQNAGVAAANDFDVSNFIYFNSNLLLSAAAFGTPTTGRELAKVSLTPSVSTQICASKGGNPWEYWVANTSFGTINNTSTQFKDVTTQGYSDYTNLSTSLNKGQTYPLSISPGLSWVGNLPNAYCRVWIDFNNNNVFDANELVLEKTNANPMTANVLIPTTATTGSVRMRVVMKFGAYPTACEAFDKGEVEDYTINITDGVVTNLPDLTLSNLNITNPSVQQGNILNWKVDIKNIGTGNAPNNFNVKAYISKDNVLSADDIQQGIIPTGNFDAGFSVAQVSGSSTIPTTLAAGQYYLILKIDADNAITESNENNNILVSATPFVVTAGQTNGSYCASKGGNPWEYWVANTSFVSINNTSTQFKDVASQGYSDYTNLTTAVSKGQTYPLSISPGLSWVGNLPNAYCRVWIDFNNNNVFDANELVLEKTNANPMTANVLIPTTATTGNVRMRVAMKFGAYPTACEAFDKGEVEDYMLDIQESNLIGKDTLNLVKVVGDTMATQGGKVHLNVTLKNTGTAPSNPNSTLSIAQNQQSFSSHGPTGYYYRNISDCVSIGRSIQPGETVTIPVVLTMNNTFTNISPPYVYPPVNYGETVVALNECGGFTYIPSYSGSPPISLIYYPYKIHAILDKSDLAIETSTTDTTYGDDGIFNYTIKISNKGTIPVRDVQVGVTTSPPPYNTLTIIPQRGNYSFINNSFGTDYYTWFVGDLAAGESISAQVNAKMPTVAQSASQIIAYVSTASNQIQETNVDNNAKNLTFYKRTATLPDLTLANLNLAVTSIQVGQVLNFKVDIKNTGTGNAPNNFNVKAYISTDNVLSADDVQNGIIPTANFDAGFSVPQVSGSSTIPTTLAAGQYYLILKVDADNAITESNENNNILVSATPFTVTTGQTGGSYCASKGGNPWEYWVANTSFGTINNTSTQFKDVTTQGYSDYTNLSTTVNKGQTYPLSISPGLSWVGNLPNAYCRVWIDLNNNKTFEANELVLEKSNANPMTANVLIPTTATTGNVRMRVAMKFGAYPTTCEAFAKGEVEDYTINISGSVVVDNSCRYQDSLQLVSLYNATNGTNWRIKWDLRTPINTWNGITLNVNGCVTEIHLGGNQLSGTLPTNLNIPNLLALDLYGGTISGAVPNFNLPNLQTIELGGNQLTGTIPNFNLPNLKTLYLYGNQLTGTIPNFNLPNLQALGLYNNQLTGTIPNFNLPNVTYIALYNNQLTGTIPALSLPNLFQFNISHNNLSGCIPLSLKSLCGAAVNGYVDISNNPNLATQDFLSFCNANAGACSAGISDIALNLTVTPSVFKPYTPLNFTISAKNTGNQASSNVKVEFKYPTGTVNGGTVTPSVGTWQDWCAGGVLCNTWTIPSLAANSTATLTVPVYVLNPSSITATTTLLSSTPADVNISNNTATITLNSMSGAALIKIEPTQLIPIVVQSISPNPSEGELTVELESLNEREVVFNFSDSFGKIVKTETRKVEKGTNKVLFDVWDLPQGMYLLFPTTDIGRSVPTKFVKM